jgi:hypothetical protein
MAVNGDAEKEPLDLEHCSYITLGSYGATLRKVLISTPSRELASHKGQRAA